MRVAVIVIGNEILSGETLDTNAQFLGQELSNIGAQVICKLSIPDTISEIKGALTYCFQKADLVISTGGLGPTTDDVTKSAISEYFNADLVFNSEVFENITFLLKNRYKTISDVHRQQAFIPSNGTALMNKMGTAPGILIRENNKIFVALPGVPYEMKYITCEHLIPYIKRHKQGDFIKQKNIKTIGLGESVIAEMIAETEHQLPEAISLAYLPSLGQVKLRLTGISKNEAELDKDLAEVVQKIQDKLSEYIYGYGDETISQVIGRMLREKGQTLAIAESCTGGYLSHLITAEPGSSDYFAGAVVAYSNQIKISELNVPESIIANYGAVSHQCAEYMAKGIRDRFNTTYGLATTGIAGPDGGSEDKPLGLVWIALSDENGSDIKKIIFDRGRIQNIQFSSINALNILRKRIMNLK